MKEYAASTSETSAPANGGATEISSRKMTDPDQLLEDKPEKISSSKMRRHKGDGSGCIYWRTITKNGKDYQQAYYQYELWKDGERLIKSSKYIPKRLLALVQALEAASSPTQEVLRVLGVGKSPGESSICPACEQPLSSLEDGCGVCGWVSPESISPKKEPSKFFRGNSQTSPPSISPKKNAEKFFRGNSQTSPPSISPKKKGRGENKIPASGSLVPVIQTRRDKEGRIVEYPKVEGERVHRELAFDYPHQFYWQYCYSVQDSDGCWQTKKVSVSQEKLWSVRSAISVDKPVSFILLLIRG